MLHQCIPIGFELTILALECECPPIVVPTPAKSLLRKRSEDTRKLPVTSWQTNGGKRIVEYRTEQLIRLPPFACRLAFYGYDGIFSGIPTPAKAMGG